MKRTVLLLLILSLVFGGCTKETLYGALDGKYSGTFQRVQGTTSNPISSQVTLYFSNKTFSGTSSIGRYPAICSGTFETEKSRLKVLNSCFFTADFDWTLIFSGDYEYETRGALLRIWRDYPDGSRDLYFLEREND